MKNIKSKINFYSTVSVYVFFTFLYCAGCGCDGGKGGDDAGEDTGPADTPREEALEVEEPDLEMLEEQDTDTFEDTAENDVEEDAEDTIEEEMVEEVLAWARNYGGEWMEEARCIRQTSDGGYIVGGQTVSFGAGAQDVWILKLDANGDVVWAKAYGGMFEDGNISLQEVSGGGYISAGYTASFGAGNEDVWILKLNEDGSLNWGKTYGDLNGEWATSVYETSDNGYVVAGGTESFGAVIEDVWILRLDSAGDVVWQKTYGAAGRDTAHSIQETSDGGYIVAGETQSFGDANGDMWILKLNDSGDVAWQKTYGGAENDTASFIQETSDSGYVVAGGTGSFGEGSHDFWILKLNTNGDVIWQKTYGAGGFDMASSIQEIPGTGYIVEGQLDMWDCLVIRLDENGEILWQKTYGGTNWDWSSSIRQTTDGGYIVTGATTSYSSGTFEDIWVLKLDPDGNISDTCPSDMIEESSVVSNVTSASPESTGVTPVDSTASVSPSMVPHEDTTPTSSTQCSR